LALFAAISGSTVLAVAASKSKNKTVSRRIGDTGLAGSTMRVERTGVLDWDTFTAYSVFRITDIIPILVDATGGIL
jgi:hypothetical protein